MRLPHPPPGFQALRPGQKIQRYHRRLPHWRAEGATYFVTFRLGDALPENKLKQLREKQRLWAVGAYPDSSQTRAHLQAEFWLDQGHGACLLQHPSAREWLEVSLRFFHGIRYDLFGYIIMPNHCHAVVQPRATFALENIVGGWKQNSSRNIHKHYPDSSQPLWQDESFDHIIRNSKKLRKTFHYMQKNAVAGSKGVKVQVTKKWRTWIEQAQLRGDYAYF